MTNPTRFGLSIVIPTFNRSNQIERTICSINQALLPDSFDVEVIVVDNNSESRHGDRYRELVASQLGRVKFKYVKEIRQGRSNACNKGLSEAEAEWVGFIDDDEALDARWLERAAYWMMRSDVDYVGGACIPDWEIDPPEWLPAHSGQYRGILGWIELRPDVTSYDDFDGELCGGNFIAKKKLLLDAGGFNAKLGRSVGNLLGGEDGDLHRRIKATSAVGFYDPNFVILHTIPASRMTVAYHLRWAYWSGVANGIRIESGEGPREYVPHLLGVPRYWIKKAIIGLLSFSWELMLFRWRSSPVGIVGLMDCCYLWGLYRRSGALAT